MLWRRLVEWGFTGLYTRFAWLYDRIALLVSAGRWQRWVLAALPALRGRVLELGCGPGHLQAQALPPGVTALVGLDVSRQMLRLARRHAPHAALVRANALSLPFADGSFETVCATFPAAYLLAEETQSELRRVLTAGGQLVVIDGGTLPPGPYRRMVELVYGVVWGRRTKELDDALPATLQLGGMTMAVERIVLTDGSSVLRLTGVPKG